MSLASFPESAVGGDDKGYDGACEESKGIIHLLEQMKVKMEHGREVAIFPVA